MIQDKHRGHDITFDQQTEEWKCGSLALADKSLTKLKAAIDKATKERRRVNVPALYLHESWGRQHRTYEVKEVAVLLLREGDRKADIKIPGKKQQEQVYLSELYPLDQKPKLDAYVAARNRENKAAEEAEDLQEKLEAMTAEAIREAVVRQADEAA